MYYGAAQRGQNIYDFAFEFFTFDDMFAELNFWKIALEIVETYIVNTTSDIQNLNTYMALQFLPLFEHH